MTQACSVDNNKDRRPTKGKRAKLIALLGNCSGKYRLVAIALCMYIDTLGAH